MWVLQLHPADSSCKLERWEPTCRCLFSRAAHSQEYQDYVLTRGPCLYSKKTWHRNDRIIYREDLTTYIYIYMYMYICVCAFYISYIRSSLLDIWCSSLGCRARQVPCCCVTRAWPISDARWGDQFISIGRIYMMIYDDIWCIMYFDYIIYIGRYIWLNVIWDIDFAFIYACMCVCVCVTAGIPLFLRHQQEPT